MIGVDGTEPILTSEATHFGIYYLGPEAVPVPSTDYKPKYYKRRGEEKEYSD